MLLSAFNNFPRGGGNMTTKLWLRLCLSRKPKVAALWGWVYLKGQVQFYNNPDVDLKIHPGKAEKLPFWAEKKWLPVKFRSYEVILGLMTSPLFRQTQRSLHFENWCWGSREMALLPVLWRDFWFEGIPFCLRAPTLVREHLWSLNLGKFVSERPRYGIFPLHLTSVTSLSLCHNHTHTHTAYWLWPQVTV